MGKIAEIFQTHADAYLATYPNCPERHREVINHIGKCRTAEAGIAVYGCESCPRQQRVYLGCGDRHCPNCQHQRTQQWLERSLQNQLPGAHFMVTFTVPGQMRRMLRRNQKIGYDAIFNASSEALKGALANSKHCGADLPGFFGVLHTWTRQLEYHPHIHYVVPRGGLDRQTKLWKNTRGDFLVPERILSMLFKAKFKDLCKTHGLYELVPKQAWRKSWVVDVEPVGSSAQSALKYLATYVFRVAISDSRIVDVTDNEVTFVYTPSGTKKKKYMTLSIFEFMRRFLQHVLPKGFMKVRYYGFMGSGCKIPLEEIKAMVLLANDNMPIVPPSKPKAAQQDKHCCEGCGGKMVLQQIWHGDVLVYQAKALMPRGVQIE